MTSRASAPIRYRLAAGALKAASLNRLTRRAYRAAGNVLGGRRRTHTINDYAVGKSESTLCFLERNGAIRDGMRVFELGTGWVHWEALFLRLFHDVECVLFDITDNRQFAGFLHHARVLRAEVPDLASRSPAERARAVALLDQVLACDGFDAVYALLGWTYVVEPVGRLDAIADGHFDLIYGSDVMEHVPARDLPHLVDGFRRILVPHGFVCQNVVEADHLCLYAPTAHRKTYLQYDDAEWRRWFDNRLQHMNRWQHCDYLALFRERGFALVAEEIVTSADTSVLAIAPRWRDYDKRDLDACFTRILVRS